MKKEEHLVELLKKNKYTITTAESCTGGMISSTIINVPGASDVINECHVTYSNCAKVRYLDVKDNTLEKFGAVSKETAYQMAIGAANLANADVAIAVTGFAGPSGGNDGEPVGLVFIACCINDDVVVEKNVFSGDRFEIRKQTTQRALELACECIENN